MQTLTRGFLFLAITLLFTEELVNSERHALLDIDGKYNVSWTYDDTDITFTLQVETTGWIGFGFSPNGGMLNSDIVTVEPTGDGEATATDRFTLDEEILPFIDDEQDWELIGRSVSAGITTLRIRRKLTVCRSNGQDISISTDTMRLIYAYGPSNDLQYHGTGMRGTRSLYLLLEDTPSVDDRPADTVHHDFMMDEFTIPDKETTYWCTLQPMPVLPKKHHVIALEPVVHPGNELHLHHMIVYGCYNSIDGHAYISSNNHSHQCDDRRENMPEELAECLTVPMFAWGVGGGAFRYPTEAGFPIGDGSAPDYILLEVHYDNPNMRTGVKDSSGLRIYYTETLRTYDVGLMSVGTVYGILIPPNRPSTELTYTCPRECTESTLPDTGIHVFAGGLHSHLLGRKMALRHNRMDGSSEIMIKDHSYDFNYQEFRHLPENKIVNKGDSLQVTCSMDSTQKDGPTYGGLGTPEEMCLAFLYYYPKSPLASCGSLPIIEQGNVSKSFYTSLGVDEEHLSSEPYQPVISAAEHIQWTAEKGQIVAESYFGYDHVPFCLTDSGFVSMDHADNIKKESLSQSDTEAAPCNLQFYSGAPRISLGATALLASWACVLLC